MLQHKTYADYIASVIEKTKGKQMTEEEYRYIASFLDNVNFLVFGTGHDSDLWRFCNRNGRTIFLENNSDWITNYEDTFLVEYSTVRTQAKKLLREFSKGKEDNLKMNLPKEIHQIDWDVIFVDSPEGHSRNNPGRMQSIYTAKELSKNKTEVFIHDCNRFVEDRYSKAMFNEVVMLTKLRHCRL